MNTINKLIAWYKSLSTTKKILVVFGVIFLIGLAGNDKSGSANNSNFYNTEFTSRTGTAFGTSGYNSVVFKEDGRIKYCNMWKEAKDKNASYYPSNMTKGTWRFVDNEKKKIEVIFTSGNNMDKSGNWEFTENYKAVKLSDGSQLSRE